MATEQTLTCVSVTAADDFSAKQFFICKIDSNGKAALGAAKTDEVAGIVQNSPAVGQPASVAIGGISKCVTGSALAINTWVGSDSAGKGTAITVAAGGTVYNHAVGKVVVASGAANGVAEVLIQRVPLLV